MNSTRIRACLKKERGCVVLDQPPQVLKFQLHWLSTPPGGWSSTQPRSFFRQALILVEFIQAMR